MTTCSYTNILNDIHLWLLKIISKNSLSIDMPYINFNPTFVFEIASNY